MNNFLHKKRITICGAGGGGGGNSSPPPPNISQYPSVLVPPQFSKVNSISSFSYAEMIDLLSDGPIEGLVNKNGKKVYDENIFEGVYLNDTPIKETSTETKQNIEIEFLKDRLKKHFKYSNNTQTSLLTVLNPRKTIIYDNEIINPNFIGDVSITSYHPNDSILEFVKSIDASFDSISLIQKAFDLSPIINEKPFLTKISIPKLILNLPKDRFDINEGGSDSPSPLKIGIIDLSNYIYFSIGSETLNSFNYFELPRSFVNNNSLTNAGKKTFKKNLVSTEVFYSYEAYDIDIFIWSIYNDEIGIKDIDIVLDKYFKNIFIFQNNFSLFNYNLIQSEFKNGSEVQAPLKYFNNVEIDTEYGKELVGPFKVSGNFEPANALDGGGIQRVKSFTETFSYRSPSLSVANIENETSDDIRYVKSWPIEYNLQGGPFLICNARLNYSQFDKNTASRTKQDAIPITHYISNENVEEVYVTLNIDRLFDTNHIDLVTDNSAVFGANSQSKVGQADLLSRDIGVNTFADIIGYNNNLGYTTGKIYFLTYGPSGQSCGYVIDGLKTTGALLNDSILVCNLQRFTNKNHPNTLYYNAISSENLGGKIPNITNLIGLNTSGDIIYQATFDNSLINYQLPNDSYIVRESFDLGCSANKTYGLAIGSLNSTDLERRLKLLNEDQNALYCFGLAQTESLISSVSSYNPSAVLSGILSKAKTDVLIDPNFYKDKPYIFSIFEVSYRTASRSELSEKAVVAHVINNYINWNLLIDKTQTLIWRAKSNLSESFYPNIFKYIINPYLNLNQLKYGVTFSSYQESIIGNLYLVGINGAYLRSQISFFEDSNLKYLKLNILDQLLEEFLLKTDQTSNFLNIDLNDPIANPANYISDFSTTRALENSLTKFENGKLIGNSSVFNFRKYNPNNAPVFNVVTDPSKADRNVINDARTLYIPRNIFLYRSQYASINSNDKSTTLVGDGGRDFIFFYNLYSNISLNTSVIPSNTNASFKGTSVSSAGAHNQYSINAQCLSKVNQTITAGTKLPAIVTVDVETGYESKEDEEYKGACEYFSYRYNIYGISNEAASVDLGRKSYDFVSACKTSLDRGGYLSYYRNVYFEDYPIYLVKSVHSGFFRNLIDEPFPFTGIRQYTGYYLTNTKDFSLGEMNLFCDKEDSDLCISYLKSGNYNIGLSQTYITGFLVSGVCYPNPSGAICEVMKRTSRDSSFYCLSRPFVNSVFFCNCLDLAKAAACLKKEKVIPLYVNPIDTFACSKSCIFNNPLAYDTYEYVDNVAKQKVYIEIYNFNSCFFQSVYLNPNWIAGSVNNLDYVNYSPFNSADNIRAVDEILDLYIITESYMSNALHIASVFSALKRATGTSFKTTILIKLKTCILLFVRQSAATSFNFSNYLTNLVNIHFSLVSPSSVTITQNNINIPPLTDDIQDDLFLNIDVISNELFAKNSASSSDFLAEMTITPENLLSAINAITFKQETVIKFPALRPIFAALVKKITGSLTDINIDVYRTKLKLSDKRFTAQTLFPKNPIIVNANFWVIFNKITASFHVIFSPTTSNNEYKELENEIPFLNFSLMLSHDHEGAVFRQNYCGPIGYTLQSSSTRGGVITYNGLTHFYYKNDGSTNFPSNSYVILKPQYYDYAYAYKPLGPRGGVELAGYYYSYKGQPTPNNNHDSYYYTTTHCFAYDTQQYNIPIKHCVSLYDYVFNLCTHPWLGVPDFNTKSFLYYRCALGGGNYEVSHYAFTALANKKICVHNPEKNTYTEYCYATYYCKLSSSPDTSGSPYLLYDPPENWLLGVEKMFLDRAIIRSDMRMETTKDIPVLKDTNFDSTFIEVRYYSSIPISNVLYQTSNTFANDAGVRIQIPKPKKDKYGNPLRRYVKITRRSHETLSVLVQKKISLNKVTEIIPQKFSYPFSSIVGTKIDARAFSQIPNRTFLCKLKKILVPSNYFPNNENEDDVRYLKDGKRYKIYDGDWDGTFKLSWSNNPAWIMLDLLINKRYGLGNYIESEQVDIWELYKIARWCDCVDDDGFYYGVSDGFGGVEPRHSFNGLISEKFNIFDMINQVASVFRGSVYYMNSLITFDDDRIKPIIGEFNNSEVKDGLFSYTNHKKDDEFTAVDVAYIDARDNYKPKIEYIEDSDGIRQRGVLKKQINTFGITSTAQARRFGKYFLYQTSKENSTVSFTTDSRALLYKPGDLIKINDELINSIKNYGEIKEVSDINNNSFKITIDKILDSGIYNTGEITLYSPIAKPKYDDFYANAQFVPENLIFCTSSPLLGSIKETFSGPISGESNFYYSGVYSVCTTSPFIEFKMNSFDTKNAVKSFSGISNVRYKIETNQNPIRTGFVNVSVTGYLNYIKNKNINNEPAKFGHWVFTTGENSFNKDKLIFDIIQNESIKYQLPYKNYFFEYFDTGRYLRFSGINEFDETVYNSINFDPTGIYLWPNLPNDSNHTGSVIRSSLNSFSIASYKKPAISYFDLIENDKPSIDTFKIINFTTGNYAVNNEIYNQYTELTLSKTNYNSFSDLSKPFKDSVSPNINRICAGFPYSLVIKNTKDRIYKLVSITENYINEYNIVASEYNLDKFKDIEDNYEVDNLKNTFNFLGAYSDAIQTTNYEKIQTPVIDSLEYFSNVKAIQIKWNSVANANSYDIYIQTPSKQTKNFVAKVTYEENFNVEKNYYENIWYLPKNFEIGTYTVSIQAFFEDANSSILNPASAISSKSINIIDY